MNHFPITGGIIGPVLGASYAARPSCLLQLRSLCGENEPVMGLTERQHL